MKGTLEIINPFKESNENIPVVLYIVKKLLAFALIFFTGELIMEAIIIAGLNIKGYDFLKGNMPSDTIMTLIKYYGFIGLLILSLLYCKFIEKRPLKSIGFYKNKAVLGYLKGILVAVVMLGISIGITMLTGAISFEGMSNTVSMPLIFAFLGGFIIQGTMEEVLCRGFLMVSLSKRVSLPVSIILSAIPFAIPHFSSLFNGSTLASIIGVVNLLLFSVFISLYMIKDGNIWVTCAIHSIWNFILYNVCGLNVSGSQKTISIFRFTTNSVDNILNGGAYGIEASIQVTVVLSICIILLYMKIKKSNINQKLIFN